MAQNNREDERSFWIQILVDGTSRLVQCTPEMVEGLNSDDPTVRASVYRTICNNANGDVTEAEETGLAHASTSLSGEVAEAEESGLAHASTSWSGCLAESQPSTSALFTTPITSMLIAMYAERSEKFNSPKYRNKVLWAEITEQLNTTTGKTYSTEQVSGKWKTLMAAYKRHKVDQNKTGSSRKEFDHEEEMAAVIGDRHDIKPVCALESMEEEEDKKTEEENSTDGEGEKTVKTRDGEDEKKVKACNRKRTNTTQLVDLLKEISEKEEKRTEERQKSMQKMHDEKMEVFKNLIQVLKDSK